MRPMRTLLIDNYDSFTFNLFHLLGEVNGDEPIVVRNDELSWDEVAALAVDNVVISPGPGRPEHARDVGVSLDVLQRAEVPVLGVCLGHQALAHVAGGAIDHAPDGHARASQRDPSRRARPVRRHPAGLRRRALPLARRRRGAGDPAGDGVDARGGRHGARAPVAPALGRAVPPRVDLHRARRRAAAQLPRPHVRAATPAVARGAARRPDDGRPARAPPHAHGLARPRGRLRRALRRPRPRRLARQRARGAGARALLVHGRARRPARPGRALRRRRPGCSASIVPASARSCARACSTTASAS